MGYELHITRAKDWSDSKSIPITWDEWARLVEADASLQFDLAGDCSIEDQPDVLWTAGDSAEEWLSWWEGQIHTKHPSDPLIGKMLELAERLDATVQGDDGERYPLSEGNLHDWVSGRAVVIYALLICAVAAAIGFAIGTVFLGVTSQR